MRNTAPFKKITVGFVIQEFDDDGNCFSQEFIAGDQVEYEDMQGEPFEPDQEVYHPFDMDL